MLRMRTSSAGRGAVRSNLLRRTFRQVLHEKNRLIEAYRHFSGSTKRLGEVRDEIDREKGEAIATLNDILLAEFKDIRFEQATWDRQKNEPGKPVRRSVSFKDVAGLRPLHWGYEFDEILGKQGGFDVILTNPPWEVFKPQAKEFFAEYSDVRHEEHHDDQGVREGTGEAA